MMNKIPYKDACLDYYYICEQCEAVHDLKDRYADNEEYGINWHEFIHDESHMSEIESLIVKWWNDLPIETQLSYIGLRLVELNRLIGGYQNMRQKLDNLVYAANNSSQLPKGLKS